MMFRTTRLLFNAIRTIHQQQQAISILQQQVACTELAYMRIGRDLIEQFLIAIDQPENHDAYRERLTTGLGFYRDEIAVREEHT